MYIKISALKEEISRYNDLILKYEDNKTKLYAEFNYISSMWNDGNTPKFFNKIDSERISSDIIINNMRSIRDVYNYIIDSYIKFGNEIRVLLNNRENLNQKFNNCIDECNNVIDLFNEMDLGLIPEGYWYTNKRTDFINIRERIKNIKDRINEILDEISDIEAEVKSRISKINIENIKKVEIDEL